MIDSWVGFFIDWLMNSYVEYAPLGVLETKLLLKQLDIKIRNIMGDRFNATHISKTATNVG